MVLRSLGFRGGIHPPKRKEETKNRSIEIPPLPARVVIPLSQHLGAPAEPLVGKGDEVKVGQVIGEAKGFVSSRVHATLSGKIERVEPLPHPISGKGLAIAIESDGKDEWVDLSGAEEWELLSKERIRALVKEAGIVGLGGATFPTHVKLSPPEDKPIDTLILNGAECEPYLTADYRLMCEHPDEIITGGLIISKALDARDIYIGIEDDKEDAIEIFKEKTRNRDIRVVSLHAKYPQGGEKQLIKAILGREVPSGGLPLDVGVVVQNVGTAFAVYQAVIKGRPLIGRVVTVSGRVKEPKNLWVRIGTPFRDVIAWCGGLDGGIRKVVMGGPMMGLAQYTLDVPVVKGTSGILLFGEDETWVSKPDPCIRCGRCVGVCSMGLLPSVISQLSEYKRFERAEEMGALDCIECGCCGYVCPSTRPIVHFIKFAKAEIMARKKTG
jgi:electron transport complex protein RnfC